MIGSFPVLTVIVFLPFAGGLLALACWRNPTLCRWVSLATLVIDLLLVLFTLSYLDVGMGSHGGWMLVEDVSWIKAFGIRYTLRLDGVSLALMLLTSYIGILCVLISWKAIDTKVASFHFFLLSTQTAILGIFLPRTSSFSTCSGNCSSFRSIFSSACGAMKSGRGFGPLSNTSFTVYPAVC